MRLSTNSGTGYALAHWHIHSDNDNVNETRTSGEILRVKECAHVAYREPVRVSTLIFRGTQEFNSCVGKCRQVGTRGSIPGMHMIIAYGPAR